MKCVAYEICEHFEPRVLWKKEAWLVIHTPFDKSTAHLHWNRYKRSPPLHRTIEMNSKTQKTTVERRL